MKGKFEVAQCREKQKPNANYQIQRKLKTLAAVSISNPELCIIASWAFLEASEIVGKAYFPAWSPACCKIGNAASTPGFTASDTTPKTLPKTSKTLEPTSWTWPIVSSTCKNNQENQNHHNGY